MFFKPGTSALIVYFLISALILLPGCKKNMGEDTISIAFLTDLHFQKNQPSAAQMAKIIEEINASDLDYVVINGDVSNTGSRDELLHADSLFQNLEKPWFIVPGNHEMNWSESAGRDFTDIFGSDRFLQNIGEYVFIGINTGPFMRMGDGHVKTEDIRWLDSTLNTLPGKRVLFFAHYPLSEGLDRWKEVTTVLHKYNIQAAFCGHGHQLQQLIFDGIPAVMGRSRVLRGDTVPGYNILELKNDSLFVFEKLTGKPRGEPAVKFSVSRNHAPVTDQSVVQQGLLYSDDNTDVEPDFFYRDSLFSVFAGALSVGDSLVVYANSDGQIHAIQKDSGLPLWTINVAGPIYSTPVMVDEKIVMGALDGNLLVIDLPTGEIIKSIQLEAPLLAKPLTEGNFVYLGAASNTFYKIDIQSGEIVWQFNEVEGLMQAEAALDQDFIVFTSWDTNVYALDKYSGKLIWKWNNGREVSLLSPGNVVPVIANNKVFVVAPDRKMTSLDLQNGQQIWRTGKYQVRESMGVADDKTTLYAKLMNDTIIAVDTRTDSFKVRWVLDAGFGYDHNPVPVLSGDGNLFAATKNGVVIAIGKSGKLRWKYKISNSAVNFLTLDEENDQIVCTTTDGYIVSFPSKTN